MNQNHDSLVISISPAPLRRRCSSIPNGSRAWVVKKYIGYMALLSLVSSGGREGEEQLPSLYITPFQGSDYPFSFVPQRFFLSIVRSSNQWFQVGWFCLAIYSQPAGMLYSVAKYSMSLFGHFLCPPPFLYVSSQGCYCVRNKLRVGHRTRRKPEMTSAG